MRLRYYLITFTMISAAAWAQHKTMPETLFEGRYVMVLLNNRDSAQFIKAQEMVNDNDGHIIHAFLPTIIQGYLTRRGEEVLCQSGLVREIVDSVFTGDMTRMSERDRMIVRVWNQQFKPLLATRGQEEDGDNDRTPREVPGKYQTSEYMMGSVAVGVVFVESDGSLEKSTENWDDYSKEDMIFQIRKGLDWWAQQGGYRASLTWNYEFKDVTTKYEPITHAYNDDENWVSDAAGKLGYGTGDGRMLCYEYANDLRHRYKTDWAFIVFAVAADNDDDGNWKNSEAVAWANLGGPLLVINNRCDGWGPERAWEVMAHETGHIFNALDEYPGGSRGNSRTGLLNVINGNAADGGIINEECIMKAHGDRACDFTRGQIGWIDENRDGVFVSDYLNISSRFNKKMMLAEAKKITPSDLKIDFEDPRVRMEMERNKKFYSDDFKTNTRGWNEDGASYIRNGEYSITNTTNWLQDEYSDVEVRVRVRWESGSVSDAFGMDMYSRTTNQFYTCVINQRGEVMAMQIKAGEGYYPEWKKVASLQKTGINELAMRCEKNTITMYVNGAQVASYTDDGVDQRGVGLRADEGVRAAFDDLEIKKIK
ncbi:MAG TPA: hypothetical protein PLA15_13040 [bacterium]|nr:hypothetical protein [bacterium]